jgi:hypothetical protein
VKQPNRKVVVFTTLVGVLTLTSALLLALAPAPLTPDASSSLFAIDAPESMDVIFQTQASIRSGRWRYIFIHHSRTNSGNGITLSQRGTGLGDHFVVCNGDGGIDGELQIGQRWTQQLSAVAPTGAAFRDDGCISICVVGDFDRTVPTPTQIRRLTQLVNSLQGRLDIPAGQVLLMNPLGSNAGVGRYFPMTAFRQQLLP